MDDESSDREVWDFCALEAVQQAVTERLKGEGLDVPRGWEVEQRVAVESRATNRSSGFGKPLSSLTTAPYQYGRHTFHLPKVFVVLVEYLEGHHQVTGLFRKAGSVNRLRTLKAGLEQPHPVLPDGTSPHDAASLLKQFLRELPSSLIPIHVGRLLEGCVSQATPTGVVPNLLQACLFLPPLHLKCLCVLLRLLHCVAEEAGHSLMDASNLAVVMAPTLMETEASGYNNVNNSLRVQKGIVELLIQNAASLGTVPTELSVVALELTQKFSITKAASLDSLDDDPLPDKMHSGGKRNKQRTSTISELVLGLGNRLRRHKRAGSGDLNLLPPKKRTKLCEQGVETRPHEVARSTGGVAAGTIIAPLMGTATKYNFTLGRSVRLPFSPLRSPASLSSVAASPSISSPVVTTPSSLLRKTLHPFSGSSPRQQSDGKGVVFEASTSDSPAGEPEKNKQLPGNYSGEDKITAQETQNASIESVNGGSGSKGTTCYSPAVDGTNESYREAVARGCASNRAPGSASGDEGSVANDVGGTGVIRKVDTMKSVSSSALLASGSDGGQRSWHRRSNSRYSATLGINTVDLSRKTLKDDSFTVSGFTPVVQSTAMTTGTSFVQGSVVDGRGGVSGAFCSPASLSASLGITTIKPAGRVGSSRRQRDRTRARQKIHRARQNENQPPPVTNVLINKYAMTLGDSENVKSFQQLDTGSPLPPLLKIVEHNVAGHAPGRSLQSDHTLPNVRKTSAGTILPLQSSEVKSLDAVSAQVAQDPGSTAGDVTGGGVVSGADNNEEQEVTGSFNLGRDSRHRRSQWFKSPWKRVAGVEFTPIKERDNLSRRALAYVVDKTRDREDLTEVTSKGEWETAGRRKERRSPELRRPLTRRTRADVAVQEWVL